MLNPETYKPEEAKYMGFTLIYNTTDLDDSEVVRIYYEKDIVEKAYRELKTTVNLHPIRKYRLSHITALVKICYLVYSIFDFIQYRVEPKQISAIYALEQLQSAYKVTSYPKLKT